MATKRTDPRVVAAVNAAMRAAYSKKGTTDRRGDFVWSVVYPQWAYKTGYAWCAAFQVWAYRKAGVDLMKNAWWFYTPYIVNFAKNHGFWRQQSAYGWQPLYDWNGDGIADHVGAANPDTTSNLYRNIEGNTSSGSAGSQSNGGGVWERYRYRSNILGWVDMHAVLAWMIDTGRWNGKTKGLPNPPATSTPGVYTAAYVRDIQTRLTKAGYSVGKHGVDGSLGPDTRAAVKRFQKAHGLVEDGLPGPLTLAALKKVAATPKGLAVDGYFGPASTKRLQQVLGTIQDSNISGQATVNRKYHARLTALRYGRGGSDAVAALQRKLGVTADRQIGPQTIRAWQRRLGVTVDGYFGPNSAKAAQRKLNQGKAF